jgi:hypothetical protein
LLNFIVYSLRETTALPALSDTRLAEKEKQEKNINTNFKF